MAEVEVGSPVIALPAPVERRLRLGPFATARDALKFVSYAAAGAVLAPFVSVYAWLPVVGIGFAFSVWRPDGEAVDERVGRWAAWSVRRWAGSTMTPAPPARTGGGTFLRLSDGRYATIVRTGGTPLAYRPPPELERVFREYAELLRVSEGVLVVRAGTTPLRSDRLVPAAPLQGSNAAPACEGYRELIGVLCRRRSLRRVDLALFASGEPRGAAARLEARTRTLSERLDALGLHPTRLRGRALMDAAHEFGWAAGGAGE
jgi:hypothetical protein